MWVMTIIKLSGDLDLIGGHVFQCFSEQTGSYLFENKRSFERLKIVLNLP